MNANQGDGEIALAPGVLGCRLKTQRRQQHGGTACSSHDIATARSVSDGHCAPHPPGPASIRWGPRERPAQQARHRDAPVHGRKHISGGSHLVLSKNCGLAVPTRNEGSYHRRASAARDHGVVSHTAVSRSRGSECSEVHRAKGAEAMRHGAQGSTSRRPSATCPRWPPWFLGTHVSSECGGDDGVGATAEGRQGASGPRPHSPPGRGRHRG